MRELEIEIMCANTPQAKGRVERVIQTLQDRLPKEMRLLNIRSREAGNTYRLDFMDDFNQRFSGSYFDLAGSSHNFKELDRSI